MSKAYAESRVRKAQEQRRKEEEQKKRQKQQAQASKSSAKSAVGGALRGATASKSTGKAYRPAVESPSYDWLSGTTRTPSQFGQNVYDDSRATPYQQYMQNADAISSADALNRYMQQANDYFNSTYTDRNAGMKLRNSGLVSGVQNANAAGRKVQQYFSGNPQIYSNGQYAEEKANYGRISSEVADPALNYRLRARTGDASVFNENMDDSTRSQAGRLFKLSQYENFTNAMRQRLPSNGHVGGSAQKQYSNRDIVAIMAGEVPDFKATQAVTGGADTYQGVADMQSAYSRDQVAADVETVTYQDGTAREIQAASERLDALVGSGYSARLQQNWSKDPNVRMEALNAYDANEQMLSNYYDQTVGANSPDEVKTTYEDYKNYLVGYNKQFAKEAKDEKLRQQLEADFGGKVQSANAKKSSGGTVAAAFAGLRGQEATKKQQGVYTMIAEGYDAARKAGYIDEWQDAQGHDPVTREYYDSGYDHMTDEEKDNFISLYNDPAQGPEVAFEYLNRLKYFTQQRDAYEMEKWTSDLAQKGFWGATAATGVGIAAGYANNAASLYVMTDRLINGDQDGKYNEYSPELRYSLIHDVALGTVGQVIEDATPNLELAGVNVPKAFYNAATSAAESFLNAVSFRHFGAAAMGVGAAGSSYRSNLEKVGSVQGYTEKDAFIDGAFDGFVETLTEYVSVENLLNPKLSPMKNAVRAPLTEMSEEVLGYLIDNGYDTIKYGSRGEIAQRYDELLVQGYSDAEARATITQEMAQELAETILVAGLSGEMMGGTQAIAAQVENSRVGSEVRKNDNVTGLLDLADTLELPKDVQRMSAEQRSAAEKGEKVSNAKLGRILRESMAKLDESGRQILSESAEKLAKNVLLENGYDGDSVNLNALAEKVVKLVTGQKLTELEMKDVARSDAATKAVQALTEKATELKKIGDKFGKLDSLMKPREAAQTEISDRLKEASAPQEVTEAFDEAVAKADEAVAKATEEAESDALSAEEERAVRLESFASEYGKNADVMQNAINDGQDVDAYAKAFKVAEVRGEDGQSFDVVKKLSVLSDLTENQVRIAYELGRGIRGARSAQLRQNTNYSGTQVQVGNVDTSAIKGHLTGAQQRSIDAARSVAQALGVNIRFFESAANEIGQYTAENGSFDGDTMTISLDIHAGSNSKFNTDYAVMQTLGHELTHFVKSFADSEVFNAYQDFVIGHLSEKMDVDAEVERVTALSAERGVNLSRDRAIEEIIANASGEALMNITQEQITQLAQANPSLAKRIGNRIQEWVKKVLDRIRAAYKGGSVKYEVARQMQDVLTEMSEKWNNALINAAQNRFRGQSQQQENAQQSDTAVENAVENSVATQQETERQSDTSVQSPEELRLSGELVLTGNGAAVSRDVARIMEDPKLYTAPENGFFSLRETDQWAEAHRKNYPNDPNFKENLALVQKLDADIVQDSFLRYAVPHGRLPKRGNGPIRSNIEYVVTFDMDTKCERAYQFQNYRQQIQNRIGRQLTEIEARNLIEQMRAYGQMIPCTYCYVEGKRMALADMYLRYVNKNGMEALNRKISPYEIFDETESARTAVHYYLDDKYNREENYTLDDRLTADGFEGYRDFNLPVSESELFNEVCDRYGITHKAARHVMEGYVQEWLYDTRMDVPHNLSKTDVDFDTAVIDESVLDFHDRALKAAQGGIKARGIENYEPYVDQVQNIPEDAKKYVNAMGGIRKHSSNDFQIQNVQDYMLFYMDLAADRRGGTGWFGHTYTKNLDYAEIFAPTNDRINVSVAFYGDNRTGITPNEAEGVNHQAVQRIQKKYSNVGAMAMVVNNDQLSYALNSDWVYMIIPFHASGMKRAYWYDVLKWMDYTSKQNEAFYTKAEMLEALRERGVNMKRSTPAKEVLSAFVDELGIKTIYDPKTGKRKPPHFYPKASVQYGVEIPGHENNAQRYFELCREYGVRPRFKGIKVQNSSGETIDVTEHPNYVRLIKETARTDSPQKEIVAEFNMDKVYEALKGFRGYDNLSEDPYGIVDEFIREYVGKNRPLGYLTERAQQTRDILHEMAVEALDKKREARQAELNDLSAAAEHAVRETEDAIPFEDYAFADVDEAGTGGREGYGDSEPKYSLRVQDQDTLDFLNNQETVTTYKTMQLVNGKLFPPMAAVVAGQYEDASVLGQWEAAVEHPELVKVDKSGKTKFTLNKGKGKGSLDAAYNPYMHSSNLVLNDQFSGAYARPNLVTVECEVPVSELTSGYRAQYAKDTVGWHSWHTGTVAGALRKANGTERKVLLSRWIKPVRILENSEVAQMYSELLYGTGIAVPDNVVPPDLLVELKKAGVPIAESGKVKTAADGDVIPLPHRFNSDSDDIRFQMRMQDDANQISDRELLASALDTVAQNDTERDYLKRYRKYIKELEQKQTQLDDLSARLKDLKADKASAKANRDLIMRMENNAKTLENIIQRTDKRLLDFEATKALKDVMAREKAAWKQTAKARSDARVARLRESNRANTQARVDAARERVRASYERKLEAKLEKAQAAIEKKTDRIVGKLENKLERTEARFEERIANMKESEKRTEYRKRILEDSATMREWLTTPTNKAHVPEFLRAPLGDFLKSIDYSSNSLLRGKGETKADAALIDAMERMSRALAQTRTQPDSLSTAEGYMGYLDLPSGFESEFNEMLDRVKGAMESGADVTDTPLNRMTSAQLKTLSDAIRTLNTSVRNMNRLIANGRYQTARDASASTIEELTKLGDRKKTGAVRDVLSGWIDWKSATPFYAFQRFGEGGKAIFEGIQDGWDRMAFNVKQVLDFTKSAYTPKQVRQWSRETHSVELSSKKKVQMTTAQLMSLYCLSRREQAMKHLQGGGIRIASFKTKGGTVNQAENYTLSTADISKLTGMLTAEQIEVADKLQAFMSSVCADWGNEVSMQRFGYNAFTEENYFPIETDSNNRAAVDESARENDLFRLLNLSATKALVQNANNAVVIQDIFDVFAAHAADMAKYNGLALPILDTLKWYNYVDKTKPVNGQFTTKSVQKSLEASYGKDAQKYVTNFIRDLNGKKEGGRNDGLINRMISNYKMAAVGANLRVGFLQITSMPRAAYVISPKYLAVGVAKNVAFRNSPIAERKVGIALWKSLGFYDTNISRNIRDLIKNDAGFFEKTRDLSMTLAEKGDYWTMGVLYGAVEAEMADKHADVKKNTAKYDQMVNDRMREIIYKTQVVDSTMTRSDIMRGKGLASIASAFMSEPTLTMNLLSESVYEARMKARAGDSKSVAQALVGSRKFGKALAATTVVCALSAVFEAVFSAYRDDDEYETFLEKFNDALWGDVSGADGGWEKFQAFWNGSIMDNFKLWNNIVFVKDISEALAGDSGDAAMWAAGFGDLAKGVQQLYKSILGDGGKPLYGSIYTTLKGVSELSGVPMSAATRDTIGLYNTIAGEMGWKRIQTSNDKPSDAAEAIMRADENGNTALADHYRRIANEHGIDEAKLQNAMKSIIQSRFDDGRIEDQRAAELLEDYAGKDADEANTQVAKWRYAKDTGLKYGDMKEDYLSGLLDEATALRYLTAEIGADKAAARIDRWNFEHLHGEDADYSSHWKLWEAFDGSGSYEGKTAEQYVREWAKTTDKKNIAAAIAGRYKDEYLRIKGTPAGNSMLEKLLNLYVAAGYEREYERDYINRKWVK